MTEKSSGRGDSRLKVKVKDKRKSESSKKWLARQLNDPYVARAVAFVIRHEEEPVFSVECARNREGSAHCEAELVLLKRGSLRHQRGETERPRIERAIAKKFPDRAVVIVRAALGRDIHLANAPPEFRGINAGLDFGGTCVNVGCVPSKMLIRAGETAYHATHSNFAGIKPKGVDIDFAAGFLPIVSCLLSPDIK